MLDGVMEYNHASPQLATGRRTPLGLLSSPLFPLFFSAQENAISYYDSKADSDYVSKARTAPALPPACLNAHPTPPLLPPPHPSVTGLRAVRAR